MESKVSRQHQSHARPLGGIVCALIVGIAGTVRADGLVYQLPPDGSWVRYDVKMDIEVQREGKEPVNMTLIGSLRLSSVGHRRVNDEPCRWIEIATEIAPAGADRKASRVLKILVPEARLIRGEDPFEHVIEMYYSQGGELPEVPIEKIAASDKFDASDYPRRWYELDRLRSVFPPPLDAARSERQSVETKLGRLTCEKVSGKVELPESPLRGGGSWAWKGEIDCLLNKRIPFGVAMLRSHTKSRETNRDTVATSLTTTILTVAEVGTQATSALLDEK